MNCSSQPLQIFLITQIIFQIAHKDLPVPRNKEDTVLSRLFLFRWSVSVCYHYLQKPLEKGSYLDDAAGQHISTGVV